MDKILFFESDKTFIQDDLTILRKHYDVISFKVSKYNPISLISLVFNIIRCKVVFIWFSSIEAAIAVCLCKIFRKKSIIVAAGCDVDTHPEIGYGDLLIPIVGALVRYAIDNADEVLPTSYYLEGQVKKNTNAKRVSMIYMFADPMRFSMKKTGNKVVKKKAVLTAVTQQKNFMEVKGIEFFINVAKEIPDIPFFIIGLSLKEIHHARMMPIPDNLKCIPKVHPTKLAGYLQDAQVYCQLSFTESFGRALAEAMLCGCIPVVSDRGAMPEIVGDLGYKVAYNDVSSAVYAINTAFQRDDYLRIRQRIVKKFSKINREKRLLEVVSRYL